MAQLIADGGEHREAEVAACTMHHWVDISGRLGFCTTKIREVLVHRAHGLNATETMRNGMRRQMGVRVRAKISRRCDRAVRVKVGDGVGVKMTVCTRFYQIDLVDRALHTSLF